MSISGIITGGMVADPTTVTVEICVQEQISGVIAADPNLIGTIIEDCAAPAFDITAFSALVASLLEVGDSSVTPSFNAAYNRSPDSAILTDNDGTPAKDVTATPLSFSSDGTFTKTANNASVTFTLTASQAGSPDTGQIVFTWRRYRQARLFRGPLPRSTNTSYMRTRMATGHYCQRTLRLAPLVLAI